MTERGVKGLGIIGAYHTRRVTPLISRALPMYLMVPEASLNGMTLADGALTPSKMVQRITEAMEPLRDDVGAALDFVYPVQGHPPMRPELGYIDFVSSLSSCLLFN